MESDEEDKYTSVSDDDPLSNLILEAIKNDSLRKIERSKKHEAEHSILMAAKLIAPVKKTLFTSKRLKEKLFLRWWKSPFPRAIIGV